ncbi:MAG: hypothetical protein A2583_12535 [Bdellovibrionales bacterium RIFOXYD1_FULL_53_11]|nr:MAG: hypothetical protein A2583_12535 [Bdellovibrionales bacterium RIFOXYD1_FULL_53_11]
MSQREFRILFVDDESDIRDVFNTLVLGELSARYKIESMSVENGNEAEKLFATGNRFDVVVCDYQMPGKNGLEVFRSVVKMQPDVAFILFSGVINKYNELLYENELKPENLYLCFDKNWNLLREMIKTIFEDMRDLTFP